MRFPDAPTERGIKHLKELQKAVLDGYRACVVFLVQMQDVKYFEPNYKTHPEFAEELKNNEFFDLAITNNKWRFGFFNPHNGSYYDKDYTILGEVNERKTFRRIRQKDK